MKGKPTSQAVLFLGGFRVCVETRQLRGDFLKTETEMSPGQRDLTQPLRDSETVISA